MNRCIWGAAIVLAAATNLHAKTDEPVLVSNVEELYAAVNDPAHAGASVMLAPGTYALTALDPAGVKRPNGGRLELQLNMSLAGVEGDPSAVVIDASQLPSSSFAAPFGRTGVIRMGRGSNSIESVTIQGNVAATAGIDTDLNGTPATSIRIADVVAGGSQRGVDVRNVGAAMAGRRVDAQIANGRLSVNPVTKLTEGIRIANLGADGGQLFVSMQGNRVNGAKVGCVAENSGSSFATIYVRSAGDTFEDNGAGCVLGGGLVTLATDVANSNSTTFEAYGSAFINNAGPIFIDAGGIVALGAEVSFPYTASDNSLVVQLSGCTVSGNQVGDLLAFGARSTSTDLAGTGNHVLLELRGATKFVTPLVVDSVPSEPARTNTVTVIK